MKWIYVGDKETKILQFAGDIQSFTDGKTMYLIHYTDLIRYWDFFLFYFLLFIDERTGPDNKDKRFADDWMAGPIFIVVYRRLRRYWEHPCQAEHALAARHRGRQHGDHADRAGLQESSGCFISGLYLSQISGERCVKTYADKSQLDMIRR